MDKKSFLDMFKDHDKNYISSIYEDIILCKNIELPVYTKEFVTPDIYMNIKRCENKLGIFVYTCGVFKHSERKMLCFKVHKEPPEDYEIDLVKIVNKSKFTVLKHSDYLGAIMSLGVKRNLFGDLIVDGNTCFVPIVKVVSQYVQDNLTTIGKCPCLINMVDFSNEIIPEIYLKGVNIIATSLRLDNIVPSICNISRGKGAELIKSGAVLLNYLVCDRKDKIVEVDDTITIRGFGKYKLKEILGETGKGRCKLTVGKYI